MRVGVAVGLAVGAGVAVGEWVGVGVGAGECVGVAVGVGAVVLIGVGLGVGVAVGTGGVVFAVPPEPLHAATAAAASIATGAERKTARTFDDLGVAWRIRYLLQTATRACRGTVSGPSTAGYSSRGCPESAAGANPSAAAMKSHRSPKFAK